jgi:hypothetical protein
VSLDHVGFLVGTSSLLGISEFLDQSHRLGFESSLEPSAGTGVDELESQREF